MRRARINWDEFKTMVKEQTGFPKTRLDEAWEAIAKTLMYHPDLKGNTIVSLKHVGNFIIKYMPSVPSINPATGERIMSKPKLRVRFKPFNSFLRELNKDFKPEE